MALQQATRLDDNGAPRAVWRYRDRPWRTTAKRAHIDEEIARGRADLDTDPRCPTKDAPHRKGCGCDPALVALDGLS